MTGQRVLAVALLVASLFVLGTMAGSLDATVTSTPDDVINVDTDSLPFAGDGASEIADSYRDSEDGDRAGASDGGDGDASGSDSGPGDRVDAGGEGQAEAPSGGDEGEQAASASSDAQQDGGGQDDSAQGTGEGFGESLWGLIVQYLVVLLALLALLGLLVLGRHLARRRDHLVARLRALADRLGLLPTDDGSPDVALPDGEGEAATVVERAWGEMLQASAANPRPSDTPRECARQVIESGADPEPVEALTDTYERVRYGDGSITADDASRALERAREITPDAGDTVHGDGQDHESPASASGTGVRS